MTKSSNSQSRDILSYNYKRSFKIPSSIVENNVGRRSGNSIAHALATIAHVSCSEGSFFPSYLRY